MTGLFASGHIIDAIMMLMLLESIAVVAYHVRTGGGPAPVPFVANVLSGLCLMAALRCGLTDAWWGWIALCLLGSLAMHLTDLSHRWRERTSA